MVEIVDVHAGDDALMADVARIHALSWQATYRGLLPDDYLDGAVIEERQAYWASAMADSKYAIVKVVVVDGQVVGFVALRDDPEDEGYDITIEHLHLLPDIKGQGLGSRLMQAGAEAAHGMGLKTICVWVFEENTAAIGFYESLGGVTDAHGMDAMAQQPDRRLGWQDVKALQLACEARY